MCGMYEVCMEVCGVWCEWKAELAFRKIPLVGTN